jgi:hypothetical protein
MKVLPRTDIEEPLLNMLRKLKLLPNAMKSMQLICDPNLAKDRTDNELPPEAQANTEV